MPDLPDDEDDAARDGDDQKSMRNRMAWFFAIAVIAGLAFATGAGLFIGQFPH